MTYYKELNEFFIILEKEIIDNNGIIYDTLIGTDKDKIEELVNDYL